MFLELVKVVAACYGSFLFMSNLTYNGKGVMRCNGKLYDDKLQKKFAVIYCILVSSRIYTVF